MRLSGVLRNWFVSLNNNDDVSQIGIKRENLQSGLPLTNEVLHMYSH